MVAEFEDSPEVNEATRAFEDLRTEIAALRKAVETLVPTIEQGRALDYSPTLGVISKNLHAATLRIDAIEKHTRTNLVPEIARRELSRVYDEGLRPVRLEFERSNREVLDAAHLFNSTVAKVRTGRNQRIWVMRASAIGLVAGLIAFPLLFHPLLRLLPVGWGVPELIAINALGRHGWDAGAQLMQADSPTGWRQITEANALVQAGGEELKACQELATKTTKNQRCTIVVRPLSR